MKSKIPTYPLNKSFSKFEEHSRNIIIADFDDRFRIFDRQFPHRHTYYEIFLLQDSSGVHHIDFEAYPFSGPVIFLTAPEQVHQLIRKKGGHGFAIQFEDDFFNNDNGTDSRLYSYFLFDHFQTHPVIPVNEAEWDKLKTLVDLALQEYKNNLSGTSSLISAYVKIILMEILRIRKQHFQEQEIQTGTQHQHLLHFKRLLNEQYTTHHEVQDYAEQLRITPRQLNSLVKQFLNKSASQVIKERLLLEAKRLLAVNSLSIKEAGYELGFEDPAYFSRFFKQGTGMTAAEFKKSVQNTG
ncbi:helix-turn-helix domain-containing protein [Chryseobacterium sp. L7]|uniref:Helix-turn-helix domain-containing protein n=1 Tax=Chryseobacterium endalhagicum TaxID=2797638 RepID=A0ABS1QA18_9FLAO|nr:helix-turn-helix domain-containing protein [Chryseobacterium endalhagicum]MBL1219450.1 helix-turn-helix domain-containing protein [Chryseobacterium endalhagicum]